MQQINNAKMFISNIHDNNYNVCINAISSNESADASVEVPKLHNIKLFIHT